MNDNEEASKPAPAATSAAPDGAAPTATGPLRRVTRSAAPRAFAGLVALAAVAIAGWLQPAMFWWPDPSVKTNDTAAADEDAATDPGLKLTEAVLAAQPRLIAEALDALPRSEPGRIKVYAVTYAPYAIEDVFKRESAVVAQAMAERFGAGDRTVQLVMNPSTTESLPWATQANLRRTLDRMGQVMDRDKDVLFLHLTSHGGRDGQLAAEAWPLESAPVTPALLKQWLGRPGASASPVADQQGLIARRRGAASSRPPGPGPTPRAMPKRAPAPPTPPAAATPRAAACRPTGSSGHGSGWRAR